ncbi:MAG: NAD(+) diphosphatase [Pseudohongiellaceae bacterium]
MSISSCNYIYNLDDGQEKDQLLLFYNQKLLARPGGLFWLKAELEGFEAAIGHNLLIDTRERSHFIAVTLNADLSNALQAQILTLRQILTEFTPDEFRLAGLGSQLLNWYQSHRYCGSCGQPTRPHDTEKAMLCEPCSISFYPRISPCVIVLVTDGDRILLARNSRYPAKFFSCLAGFMEVGETPEETVAREVREETGIEVSNIRYVKSQSWPFPSQLMIGFHADYAGGQLRPDGIEIDDAGWFDLNTLPSVPSAALSVAGVLIEQYRQSRISAQTRA